MKNAISLIVMMIFLSCHVVGQDDAAQPQRKSGNNNADTDLFGANQTKRVKVRNPFDVKTGEGFGYGEEMDMYGGDAMESTLR